ncbi:MAG: heparinase II/III family protein [Anaerolineales bacterium]|nr:heparinase II/III family protein [Anaerolineales bacterium]
MTLQKSLFADPDPNPLLEMIRRSPAAPLMLSYLRQIAPDLGAIPQTTYTRYREFEYTGERDGYQQPYYLKRSLLTRAVVEMILADQRPASDFPSGTVAAARDAVHDLLWSICEETSWVLPAHEEQGPDFWDLKPSPRTWPWGTNTMLTRQPDSIDLFSAETGASLAETVYLLGDRLSPEVVQRVRQEVDRHIFQPYLAYGRQHWWYKGALNWNGVCNGAIGLAFLRLEKDPRRLVEALEMVLEGFEAYIATGFEADGGSIEGPGYWGYGLVYYVTLAEALHQRTSGEIDLLASPRLKDIARYPLGMALAPGTYINFGDATEQIAFQPGILQRLAERTGVEDLKGLIIPPENLEGRGVSAAKLAIILRDIAWWDGQTHPFPASARQDFHLPDCAVVKFTGQTNADDHGSAGKPVVLAAKAGHNDGHHSHTDVGHFIYHINGESLLCDPGRGLYSRDYFRQERYQNIFCNSFSHNVPRIAGQLQSPGPEFGGNQQYHGQIVAHGEVDGRKYVTIDFHRAYNLPGLSLARRQIALLPGTGEVVLEDHFEFTGEREDASASTQIEEAFVTWGKASLEGAGIQIVGKAESLYLFIQDPPGARITLTVLEEDCRVNRREGVLTRIGVLLPPGSRSFKLFISPG